MHTSPRFAQVFLLASLLSSRAQTVDEWLRPFPAHTGGTTGAIDLPVSSACLLRFEQKEVRRVDGAKAPLIVTDGVLTRWDAEAGRLAWKVEIPSNGTYRVTAFLGPQPGRDCTLMLSFLREGKETRVNAVLVAADVRRHEDSSLEKTLLTSGSTILMGEAKLTAGPYTLVCRPSQWIHPFEMANLAGFRLAAKGTVESASPLALPAQPIPILNAGPSESLFPTGGLAQLPEQRGPKGLRLVAFTGTETPGVPAAEVKPGPFSSRDHPEEIRALALRLQANLAEATPGLEAFRRAMIAKDWPGALRAYRDSFFPRLKHPESMGAQTQNMVKEHLFGRGKAFLLKRPDPDFLQANKSGKAGAVVRDEAILWACGAPGAVRWIPDQFPLAEAGYGRGPDNHPFWKTEEGKNVARKIEICRMMKFLPADSDMFQSGGFFPALLYAYAVDGDQEALKLWCAYLDDFVMRAVDQYARYPITIRAATELEPQQFRVLLMLWRIILDERPEFARDFDPAALARFLLFAIKEYPAYTIRAKRAEQANWGIMGICDLAHLCRFFPEFKVMRYVEKETWRLWQANFFQHRTPDGENVEAWDTGHNAVDVEYAKFAEKLMPPPWASAEESADYLDQVRVNQRSLLTHLTPDGQYWPAWLPEGRDLENDVRNRWLRNGWLDLILHEPEVQRRIETTLLGAPGPLGAPERRSDYAPYAAMAYLREGWKKDDAMWTFQNFQTRSQALADCGNTAALLSKSGRILAEIHPLAVNGKPPNRFWGKVASGGKTDYSGQASLHAAGGRMFSTDLCQFVQGRNSDPYAIPAENDRFDVTGLYQGTADGRDDPAPIAAPLLRRLFLLPDGLSLVCDRMETQTNTVREYTQFVTFPALPAMAKLLERLPEWRRDANPLVWMDAEAAEAGTRLPGLDNVHVSFFGPGKPALANRLNRKREHERSATTPLQDIEAAVKAKKDVRWIDEHLDRFPVSARWTFSGKWMAGMAIRQIPVGAEKGGWEVERMETPGDRLEVRARHRDGTRVHFLQRSWQADGSPSRDPAKVSGLETDAEAVLVIEQSGRMQAWLFGANRARVDGKELTPPAADAVMEKVRGAVSWTPIRNPLEVKLTPSREPDVFTDTQTIVLEASEPDAEIRYTLDGTEPTLDSASYGKPLLLDKTTRIKARPFRRGLASTPWNFDGVDSGKTVSVIFTKREWVPASEARNSAPGLAYEYVEGDWTSVFLLTGESGLLPVKKTGVIHNLFDGAEMTAIRETKGAYGLRCAGWMRVPLDGVYTFHAPEHLFTTTLDAGFDLRVWVDGEDWSPCPRPQAENTWSVPLRAGWHKLRVSFADYREQPFRNDFWMTWRKEQMSTATPLLRISGPGLPEDPVVIPPGWLGHE